MTMITNSASPHQSSKHGSSSDNQGKVQSQSKRFVFSTWADSLDHELCAYALAIPPERTPIAGRTGVATAKWTVVERREDSELICNRLHSGPCAWPWAVEIS